MRGLQENSLSQRVLIKINEFLETTIPLIFWDYKELRKVLGISPMYTDSWKYSRFPKYIDSLKRRNYIQEIKIKKGKKLQLTSKGKMEIIKYEIKIKTQRPKWDRKWRGICWDVPEVSRKDRDYLRAQLRWLGFKELQKSLWIFPFEIKSEVKELVKLYKKELAGDIRFLTIEKLEDDQDFRRYFHLA